MGKESTVSKDLKRKEEPTKETKKVIYEESLLQKSFLYNRHLGKSETNFTVTNQTKHSYQIDHVRPNT